MTKKKPEAEEPMKVAGQTVALELPARVSARLGIFALLTDRSVTGNQQSAQLLGAAALMLCWPTAQAKLGLGYHHRMLDYGADVIDALVEEGKKLGQTEAKTMGEIIRAGNRALDLVVASLPAKAHMEEAEGNSEARKEDGSARSSK